MNALLNQIHAIAPMDDVEQQHHTACIAWIASGAHVYRLRKPDVPKQHLVSYAVVVDPEADAVLLVDHRNAGLWLPCGGHVEPDEHPRAAAKRELCEELGVTIPPLFDAPIFITMTETVGKTAGHIDVSLWYVFHGTAGGSFDFDEVEFAGIRWFNYADIPFEQADPHMSRFVTKLRAYLSIQS